MLGKAGYEKSSIRNNYLVSLRELSRVCYNPGSQKLAKTQCRNLFSETGERVGYKTFISWLICFFSLLKLVSTGL